MPEHRPLTPAKLRSQRRNAALSTGPQTLEGRRRANLNRRRLELPRRAVKYLKFFKGDTESLLRVWRDLLAVFWFMGPEMEPFINVVAWDWWLKQHLARRGESERFLRAIDVRLENELAKLVGAYRLTNREWRCRLTREIGSSGKMGLWHLRKAVETRLPDFEQLAAQGKLPEISALEREISRLAQMMSEMGAVV